MPLPGRMAGLEQRAERWRRRLEDTLAAGGLDGELHTLAPLLARHDPVEVAAAALRLAAAARSPEADAADTAQAAQAAVPAFARVWVGIGKKDNVKPGDLVGALTREVGLPADTIGRIETRDLFCLVEVRADRAEAAVKGLTGITIRGRRLSARVDRGPGSMARPPRRV
jgi:ATP-dependent RNA helicase DeaD